MRRNNPYIEFFLKQKSQVVLWLICAIRAVCALLKNLHIAHMLEIAYFYYGIKALDGFRCSTAAFCCLLKRS